MNNNISLFDNYITSGTSYISFLDLIINSIIIIVISFILRITYIKCSRTLSDKRSFSNNFFILAYTTMLIIMVVKSSLALSLGLIGALSIVRFRSAIKEPEELSYLFLNIAIGLGLGASQQFFVIVGFAIIILSIWVKHYFTKKENYQNIVFVVKSKDAKSVSLDEIIKIISNNVTSADLKRFDEDGGNLEAIFNVEVNNVQHVQNCRKELLEMNKSISLSFIDNR